MSHTVKSKTQLVARVRRIAGQLKRIEAALEEEAGCEAVLHLLAGARGAFNGLSEEIIADFVREHVPAPRLLLNVRQRGKNSLPLSIATDSKHAGDRTSLLHTRPCSGNGRGVARHAIQRAGLRK